MLVRAARPALLRTAHKARRTQSRRRPPVWLQLSFFGSLLTVSVGLTVGTGLTIALGAAALVRETCEQLVDQALQDNGRLRLINAAAVLEVGVRATRAEADVLATEQALRLNAGEAVIGNLVVLLVNAQADHRLEAFGVEANGVHLTNPHPRHGNGR